MTLIQYPDSTICFLRGNTDVFDDERENFHEGYFCLSSSVNVNDNVITFTLNSSNYCYVNRPISIDIERYEGKVPQGYDEWLQHSPYFWKGVKFVGSISGDKIVLTNQTLYPNKKLTFTKADYKFVDQKYNSKLIDDKTAYENSRTYKTSGDYSKAED